MLKMQQYSGLSRVEVRKAKLTLPQNTPAQFALAWAPINALMFGLSVVIALLGHVALAAGVLLIGLSLATIANVSLRHFFNQFVQNDAKVLVVRDGLARLELVSDLVPGDRLIGQAGMVLPVDVRTDQVVSTPTLLAGLMRLVALTPASDLAIAGTVLTTDAAVTVVAVGQARFCLSALLPALMQRPTVAFIAGLQAGLPRLFAPLATVVAHFAAAHTPVDPQTRVDVIDHPESLVGNTRHAATLTAFRYNQDPVSWQSR